MRVLALVILFLFSLVEGFGQRYYWQQQVNYTIDVTLNDEENTLTGFEKIEYINNSPDTLLYIFIHLWPNAYKNDRTAFSEQLLKNDRTDFYFADEEMRGYINRLDFKAGDIAVSAEETKDIDIVKVLLPQPLAPKQSVIITTAFHVKLPYLFSRGGYHDQFYAITQWYPKVALYDKDGWHAMPYLDQGEFYNDFGNYKVNITLPENYKIAATGVLEQTEVGPVIKKVATTEQEVKIKKPFFPKKEKEEDAIILSSAKQKTCTYTAEKVTDFAWFADKRFIVKTDTIQLPTHTVKTNCYILPENAELYANSIKFTKNAIRFYSQQFGEYPYPAVNVVSAPQTVKYATSMEYPMITMITETSEIEVDATVAHEVGHNWLMGILSTNERDHAWMDEGINTYVERRYRQQYYPSASANIKDLDFSGLNGNWVHTLLNTTIGLKKDQPIDTTSAAYSAFNYGAVVYEKTADWMQMLEATVGKDTMLKIMNEYYARFAFLHPQPGDLKKTAELITGKDLSNVFNKLYITGAVDSGKINKTTKLKFVLPGFNDKHNYITFSPAVGYNNYDKVMIGGMIHNYQLPLQKFQFLITPMYATGSSSLAGATRFAYNHFTKRSWLEASVSGMRYSINDFEDAHNPKLNLGLTRIVPTVRFSLYNKNLREKSKWVFQARSFILKTEQLDFKTVTTPTDTFNLASKQTNSSVVNQLKVTYDNSRKLYPYNANVTIDQGKNFLRIGFTGKYFFNYNETKKGIAARVFVGKYFKLGSSNAFGSYATNLNMSGPKGDEDYTFSNYFIGRNEFEGWQSQQIMERDGFFKVRTDLLGSKIGKSDDWLIALNLSGNIPDKINPLNVLPFELPVKLFLDIGTYSEAWKDDEITGKILYDAGLQFSFFSNCVNVYLPLLYSKVYSDYFKSYLGEKRFAKTISFNINLDVFQLNKLSRDIPW
ncbi:hypothetical protein BH10BAC2_BH10BAC2_43390 [soil metagenome]